MPQHSSSTALRPLPLTCFMVSPECRVAPAVRLDNRPLRSGKLTIISGLLCALAATACHIALAADPPSADEQFETQVRPLLARRCQGCHGHEKQQGGLRLDTRDGLRKGGDSGPVLEPEKLAESRLLSVLTHEGELKMPPKEPLPAAELALLKEWILNGAHFPADAAPSQVPPASPQGIAAQQAQLWSLRPIAQPPLPQATHPAWEQNPIDRFVSARLAAAGLSPSPRVDR
ncbi:MAG: c-type cytochrome domain-containing protein, partial [Planctomycetaceae bacterium]